MTQSITNILLLLNFVDYSTNVIAQPMVCGKICFHFRMKTAKILTNIVIDSKQQRWMVSNYPLPRGQVKKEIIAMGLLFFLLFDNTSIHNIREITGVKFKCFII